MKEKLLKKIYEITKSHVKLLFTIVVLIYCLALYWFCCQSLNTNDQMIYHPYNILIILIMLAPVCIIIYIFYNDDLFSDYSNKDKKLVLLLSIILLIVSFAIIYIINYNDFKYSNGSIPNNPLDRFVDMLYFSTMTLTTVGYGDITPVSKLAKLMVIIESLTFTVIISFIIMNFKSKTNENKEKDTEQNEENNNE